MRRKSTLAKAFAGLALSVALVASPFACRQSFADNDRQGQDEIPDVACQTVSEETFLIDPSAATSKPPGSSRLTDNNRSQRRAGSQAAAAKYKAGIPCIPLMLVDDPNTLIVCDRDAVIRAEKRSVTLSRGRGIFMVGRCPLTVETPLGTVSLPGASAAIVEQTENGLLRVAQLTGAASNVSVKRWQGIKAYSASSGQEICLAPRSVAASALVPRDGVARVAVSRETGEGGIQFVQNSFTPKLMLDKLCLLECDANSLFQVRHKVYELRKTIVDEASGAKPTEAEAADSAFEASPVLIFAGPGNVENEPVTPVTYSEPAPLQMPLTTTSLPSCLLRYSSNCDIALDHPLVADLRSGEVLVWARKASFVRTPDSMLKIEPGTLALVSVGDNVTKVRNLWENHRNGLCQTVENQPFYVAAGDESLVGKNLRSLYLSASKDMIGRRLTHLRELPGGKIIHFAEVSLISLAESNNLLAQLTNSNDPVDISLMRKLHKMAAILVQISASHGLYELMQPLQWRHDAKSSSLPDTI